jgi:hypothetical protein
MGGAETPGCVVGNGVSERVCWSSDNEQPHSGQLVEPRGE